MAGQAMVGSFSAVLHVSALVPTLSGVTTIWAGGAVAPPLFDRKNLKLMIEWPTTASNISTHYDLSRVSVPY